MIGPGSRRRRAGVLPGSLPSEPVGPEKEAVCGEEEDSGRSKAWRWRRLRCLSGAIRYSARKDWGGRIRLGKEVQGRASEVMSGREIAEAEGAEREEAARGVLGSKTQ